MPLASGLPLQPCCPPSEGRVNRLCGYAIDTGARMLPHRRIARGGSLQVPAFPQIRLVSLGPRYPPGRICKCDASVALQVVRRTHRPRLVLRSWKLRPDSDEESWMQKWVIASTLFSSESGKTSSAVRRHCKTWGRDLIRGDR